MSDLDVPATGPVRQRFPIMLQGRDQQFQPPTMMYCWVEPAHLPRQLHVWYPMENDSFEAILAAMDEAVHRRLLQQYRGLASKSTTLLLGCSGARRPLGGGSRGSWGSRGLELQGLPELRVLLRVPAYTVHLGITSKTSSVATGAA